MQLLHYNSVIQCPTHLIAVLFNPSLEDNVVSLH